jgi:DNA-binding response OmpR family regulator
MMNDVVVTDNPVKPPSMHGFLAPLSVDDRSTNQADQIVRFADVTVDVYRRRIVRGGEEVEVTPAEYNLLVLFVQNADRPLTRDAILNAAWGYDCYPNTRTVDAHVCKLRQKLESNPAAPRHFLTIHRVGYRFVA